MKIRLLSLVLAVLLVFPGAALADNSENVFADFTTDELLILKVMVETELAARADADKAVSVPCGIYIVGIDIPVGIYTLIAEETVAGVKVYDSNGVKIISETLYKDQRIGCAELLYGYKVDISGGSVTFTKYKGLGF